MESPIRLEISLTDTRSEMKSSIGDSGNELKIVNEIVGETIQGTVFRVRWKRTGKFVRKSGSQKEKS